jgi:hypothetical protein
MSFPDTAIGEIGESQFVNFSLLLTLLTESSMLPSQNLVAVRGKEVHRFTSSAVET